MAINVDHGVGAAVPAASFGVGLMRGQRRYGSQLADMMQKERARRDQLQQRDVDRRLQLFRDSQRYAEADRQRQFARESGLENLLLRSRIDRARDEARYGFQGEQRGLGHQESLDRLRAQHGFTTERDLAQFGYGTQRDISRRLFEDEQRRLGNVDAIERMERSGDIARSRMLMGDMLDREQFDYKLTREQQVAEQRARQAIEAMQDPENELYGQFNPEQREKVIQDAFMRMHALQPLPHRKEKPRVSADGTPLGLPFEHPQFGPGQYDPQTGKFEPLQLGEGQLEAREAEQDAIKAEQKELSDLRGDPKIERRNQAFAFDPKKAASKLKSVDDIHDLADANEQVMIAKNAAFASLLKQMKPQTRKMQLASNPVGSGKIFKNEDPFTDDYWRNMAGMKSEASNKKKFRKVVELIAKRNELQERYDVLQGAKDARDAQGTQSWQDRDRADIMEMNRDVQSWQDRDREDIFRLRGH